MIGKTISHYKILEKLGEGGMGVVYKAEDNKLKRPVALKFISPVLTCDKFANKQFIFEAQTASSLDHQNISTIYEIDESDDGSMFISMAYYTGETLREKISRGRLEIKDVVDFASQIAEGLSKAHRKGIIHKDIKPANIMIDEDNTVKIIDFGLSKLLSARKFGQVKHTMGTISYMSPEQIKGKEVDYRTDIWSLGVVMYEMITNVRPFEGEYDQAVIYSILNENPRPMDDLTTRMSRKLERIVFKALAKNPSERYPNMEELLAELRHLLVKDSTQVDEIKFRQRILMDERPIKSIAVLPLINLSQDPENEYFADGMTDALITYIAKIQTLKIISRTSTMRFKKTDKSLPEIAAELNVDAIVEGSVLRLEKKVQITAQLIYADTDTHLWAESYECDLQDILILQSEIAQAIASEINVSISQHEEKQLEWTRPINPEIYDNYLKGCFHFYKLSPEQFDKALQYYQLTLNVDPNYALAHAGIASVWFARSYWGVESPKKSFPLAKKAVLKALEQDDRLEEAHDVLARIKFFYEWDWKGAEKEFRHAIRLNPNYSDAHLFYSAFLRAMKRDEEAMAEVKRGLELDPINFFSQSFYVGHLLHMRNYAEAIIKLNEILKSEPNFTMAHRYLWIAYHQKQMYNKAVEEAQMYFSALGKKEISEVLKLGYLEAGYKGAMNLAAEKFKKSSNQTYIQPIWIARLYAYAGNKNQTIEWLKKAYDERDPLMVNLKVSSDWDNLGSETQFQNLLLKMNLCS